MGCVYLLGNLAMPNFYKIGSSRGCPFARARQLSAASGVPVPFEVVCYFQTENPRRDEERLHQFLVDFRFHASREFFRLAPEQRGWLVGLFQFHPHALRFVLGDWKAQFRFIGKKIEIENPWAQVDADGWPAMSSFPPDYLEFAA